MEEDITCKFSATNTVLKGVFIFLNSIFVRGYLHFFPIPKRCWLKRWDSSSVSTLHNSYITFSLWERKASCFSVSCNFFYPSGSMEWKCIHTKVMSYTLGWDGEVLTLRCCNKELASFFSSYTYNLIFSICNSFIFSNYQCHVVIKFFNWTQPKFCFFLFTNGLRSR